MIGRFPFGLDASHAALLMTRLTVFARRCE